MFKAVFLQQSEENQMLNIDFVWYASKYFKAYGCIRKFTVSRKFIKALQKPNLTNDNCHAICVIYATG